MNVFRPLFYACVAGALWGIGIYHVGRHYKPPTVNQPIQSPSTPSQPLPDEAEPESAFVKGAKSTVVPIPHVGGDDMTDERDAMTIKKP